jgi:hypothetical protein
MGAIMWPMTFQLPPGLPHDFAQQLQWSCLAGGPDNMPWPTELTFNGSSLTLTRPTEESGHLVAPWRVGGLGQVMGTSATLMTRQNPYHLLVELARGKVNQVRCQAADWQAGGLQVPGDLAEAIKQAAFAFGRGVCSGDAGDLVTMCTDALSHAYDAAARLVGVYESQVFYIRHNRQDRLWLGCGLGPSVLDPALGGAFVQTFNRASLPLSWHVGEANETSYDWSQGDQLLAWAEKNRLEVTAGPLIDFSSSQLPAWLWLYERDPASIATFMSRYVEAAVRRYRSRVRRWQLTSASNWARVLGLSEDNLMELTFRMAEAARNVDPALEVVVGISQPWGEYMAARDQTYSPFIFADNLIRTGLNLSGLNLEIVMGVQGRGSYCRDLLETSRLLDLYALLGVPLHVTLAYPASRDVDADADPELSTGAGWWRAGFTPEAQADWSAAFAELALCKPFVQTVQWAHYCDRDAHLFPHCGLLDREGRARPSLASLRKLRTDHVR